ncbi:uncharacterized protein J3D65DRAFT_355286 [Phyllosticta citribraziliensis]|uniref:Uncharacterized protein n=1 Tax=Phyllosticta citribraziliensis TaxID=989973 RepID=A0ABR1LNT2_9PEZI
MKPPATSQSLKRNFDHESPYDDVSRRPYKKQRSTPIDDEDDLILCLCHRPSKAPAIGKTTERVVFIDDIKHLNIGKKLSGKSKSVSTNVDDSSREILTVITDGIQQLILRALKEKKTMGCSGRFVSVPADECSLSLASARVQPFSPLLILELECSLPTSFAFGHTRFSCHPSCMVQVTLRLTFSSLVLWPSLRRSSWQWMSQRLAWWQRKCCPEARHLARESRP